MRFGRLVTLIAVLAVGFSPSPGQAQGAPDRVRVELERTDRRIERAQAVVAEADNAAAHSELDEAVRGQAKARTAHGQNHPRIALDLTLSARAHADRAIALVNRLPDPDRVLAQIERTRELIDRARQRIGACDNDRARAVLLTAIDMQGRAEEAARAGRYLAAIQLTFGARERVHQALRLCNLAENAQASADRALQRTDELILQARERAAVGPEPAQRLLARAEELQAHARQEYHDEHYEGSVRLTLSARAFAFRALRHSGGVN